MTFSQLIRGLEDIKAGRIPPECIIDMSDEIIEHLTAYLHAQPWQAYTNKDTIRVNEIFKRVINE